MVPAAVSQDKIVQYLKRRGGAIESVDGRGLTQALAAAAGGVSISSINATLGRLEADGVISRDVRGKRTYRIELARPTPTDKTIADDPAVAELSASVAQLAARLSEFERMAAAQQARPPRWWRRRAR